MMGSLGPITLRYKADTTRRVGRSKGNETFYCDGLMEKLIKLYYHYYYYYYYYYCYYCSSYYYYY